MNRIFFFSYGNQLWLLPYAAASLESKTMMIELLIDSGYEVSSLFWALWLALGGMRILMTSALSNQKATNKVQANHMVHNFEKETSSALVLTFLTRQPCGRDEFFHEFARPR